ncbi:MAG: methenyltetrahydromethanopterin cyclohydrolase [Burkholderiales bacterium]
MKNNNWPSVNQRVAPLVEDLVANAAVLRVGVARMTNGTRLVDAGIKYPGGLEAGRRIAEICLAGMGSVNLGTTGVAGPWRWGLMVYTSNPVLACLASQYAGWSLSHGEGKGKFQALGSGPGRALAAKEELFKELEYKDQAQSACLVLEVDQNVPVELADKVARNCNVPPSELTLIVTPTRSLAGTVQVVARVLEVALHKVHALGFPLHHVVDGMGSAPLPPPAPDFLTGMGRTNDAILFAGQVQLYVNGGDEAAQTLAQNLPSSRSKDYGKPFAKTFKEYKYDFYQIDPMLFAPAQVTVTALQSGRSFHAGKIDLDLLNVSFGGT